jgi:ankyrin repeat protein
MIQNFQGVRTFHEFPGGLSRSPSCTSDDHFSRFHVFQPHHKIAALQRLHPHDWRVEALLNADPAQVNAFAPDGFQPLGLAAFFGHPRVARLLLERGADPNIPSRNGLAVQPLNSAVAGQHLEVARLLLNHGADPNARQGENFAPLHGAAQNGQVEMIRLLLERGADPRATAANGKTPLDYALEENHADAAQILRGSR